MTELLRGDARSPSSATAPNAERYGPADRTKATANATMVSIILCTRNRALKLRHTLEAIQAFDVPEDADYEVVVVDNGSTDDTSEVCASFEASSHGRLRRIFLGVPGLSRARNAGFAVASGNLIAFLDDDILPHRDWLLEVCREFSRDPALEALSGRVELFNPADSPIGVRRRTDRVSFTCFGDAFSLFTGCSFAVRRTLIERVGLFDPDLGIGGRFGSAEDSDFFYRTWKSGARMIYVPTVHVEHDHGRRTRAAKMNTSRDYIVGRGAFYAKQVLAGDRAVVRHFYWELRQACQTLFSRRDEFGWRHLAWLLKGFLGYGVMRCARSLRSFVEYRAPVDPGVRT